MINRITRGNDFSLKITLLDGNSRKVNAYDVQGLKVSISHIASGVWNTPPMNISESGEILVDIESQTFNVPGVYRLVLTGNYMNRDVYRNPMAFEIVSRIENEQIGNFFTEPGSPVNLSITITTGVATGGAGGPVTWPDIQGDPLDNEALAALFEGGGEMGGPVSFEQVEGSPLDNPLLSGLFSDRPQWSEVMEITDSMVPKKGIESITIEQWGDYVADPSLDKPEATISMSNKNIKTTSLGFTAETTDGFRLANNNSEFPDYYVYRGSAYLSASRHPGWDSSTNSPVAMVDMNIMANRVIIEAQPVHQEHIASSATIEMYTSEGKNFPSTAMHIGCGYWDPSANTEVQSFLHLGSETRLTSSKGRPKISYGPYPTKTGEIATLDDIAGFATQEYVQSVVDSISLDLFVPVAELPTTGLPNRIYLIQREESETGNVYDEHIWINGAWESLGSITMGVSGYVTQEWIEQNTLVLHSGDAIKQHLVPYHDNSYTLGNAALRWKEVCSLSFRSGKDITVSTYNKNSASDTTPGVGIDPNGIYIAHDTTPRIGLKWGTGNYHYIRLSGDDFHVGGNMIAQDGSWSLGASSIPWKCIWSERGVFGGNTKNTATDGKIGVVMSGTAGTTSPLSITTQTGGQAISIHYGSGAPKAMIAWDNIAGTLITDASLAPATLNQNFGTNNSPWNEVHANTLRINRKNGGSGWAFVAGGTSAPFIYVPSFSNDQTRALFGFSEIINGGPATLSLSSIAFTKRAGDDSSFEFEHSLTPYSAGGSSKNQKLGLRSKPWEEGYINKLEIGLDPEVDGGMETLLIVNGQARVKNLWFEGGPSGGNNLTQELWYLFEQIQNLNGHLGNLDHVMGQLYNIENRLSNAGW